MTIEFGIPDDWDKGVDAADPCLKSVILGCITLTALWRVGGGGSSSTHLLLLGWLVLKVLAMWKPALISCWRSMAPATMIRRVRWGPMVVLTIFTTCFKCFWWSLISLSLILWYKSLAQLIAWPLRVAMINYTKGILMWLWFVVLRQNKKLSILRGLFVTKWQQFVILTMLCSLADVLREGNNSSNSHCLVVAIFLVVRWKISRICVFHFLPSNSNVWPCTVVTIVSSWRPIKASLTTSSCSTSHVTWVKKSL